MKRDILIIAASSLMFAMLGCSANFIRLSKENLEVRNRDIVSISGAGNALSLNNRIGDGIAILKDLEFNEGIIELELKGEDNPGKSFVGIAFNIQNDSTYEVLYFRPFNFRSNEKLRREHSVQYTYHPNYTWRFLRSHYEGRFEAEYPRQPSPEDWFGVRIKIDSQRVYVYDRKTNKELMVIKRLTDQKADRIGFWTGYNSKGEFRNLRISK